MILLKYDVVMNTNFYFIFLTEVGFSTSMLSFTLFGLRKCELT